MPCSSREWLQPAPSGENSPQLAGTEFLLGLLHHHRAASSRIRMLMHCRGIRSIAATVAQRRADKVALSDWWPAVTRFFFKSMSRMLDRLRLSYENARTGISKEIQ